MKLVTVHRARTQLSQLIAAAVAGEDVVIRRGQDAAVRLVPVRQPAPLRQFGALAGRVIVGAEFFEPLPAGETSR
jgi:antitoxin (DNA-binding transcriptional repressor) of toxin-antitoxin stability system